MIGVTMGDQDQIGFIEFCQILFSIFIRGVGNPGVNQENFPTRRFEFKRGMAVPGQFRFIGSKSCRYEKRTGKYKNQ